MPTRAQLFGSGPSLDLWLAQGAAMLRQPDTLRGALNETCRFLDCDYTFAADPVDRFAEDIPASTILVTTREAIDNARTAAPACARIIAPVDTYRGSVILACKWLLAHRHVREFELIGIDGGTARAALPWISPHSGDRSNYNVIRAALLTWASRAGVRLTFWSPALEAVPCGFEPAYGPRS